MRILMSVLALLLFASHANGEKAVILTQRAAPLEITKYEAVYQSESRSSYSSHPDQIRHSVTCRNISTKVVVAYQIGLAVFDAFNGFLDKFNGWSVKEITIQGETTGVWNQTPYAAFTFQSFGTGVAYVNAVRFEDGSIWRADLTEVLTELQKFEKDLKKEDLQDKKK